MKIGLLSRNARLYSSRRLIQAIRGSGHDPVIIDPLQCLVSVNPMSLRYRQRRFPVVDVVIPRIGAFGNSIVLAIVRQLELMGVPVLNSSQAIAIARDKLATLQVLSSASIPVPGTMFSVDEGHVDRMVDTLGTPLVLKALDGMQGAGVVLGETVRSIPSIIDWFRVSRADFIAQEFIPESAGTDIRILVVDGQVVAAMRRQGVETEFRSNLHRGGTAEPVVATPIEMEIAVRAAEVVGLNLAGVDILRTDRGPMVMEVNASPGLEGIESTTTLDLA
ncbi:RimK family alpha-L-glutamate ligase, partial [bacterium]|nr:RimK family alpha-L-glutamate ligase [bacterium]